MPHHAPLIGEVRADICVIGAGFAGLSAALHLAERGARVVVLEANRVGWGASGRNGGQLGVGPRADIRDYEAMVGPEDAAKVWEISVAANRLVRDLVKRHDIDCALTDGYLDCGWRREDAEDSRAYAEHVATRYNHADIRPVERDEMEALLGTERYHGGFYDRLGAHLHPLRLALGLARAAVAAGAVIHETSRVTALEQGGVRTATGTVRAPEVLLACNGYLDGLSPVARAEMLPVNSFVIATEPLTPERAARVNALNACAADSLFVVNYFRLTPDLRMLWGGSESVGRHLPGDIAQRVRQRMLMVYPDLADLKIDHAWGGALAITGTRMPSFQNLGSGVRAIGGWSGSGVHMATMGGRIAANAILQETDDWDLLARMPTPRFPGTDWLRVPLLRAAMIWYGLRDRF